MSYRGIEDGPHGQYVVGEYDSFYFMEDPCPKCGGSLKVHTHVKVVAYYDCGYLVDREPVEEPEYIECTKCGLVMYPNIECPKCGKPMAVETVRNHTRNDRYEIAEIARCPWCGYEEVEDYEAYPAVPEEPEDWEEP